MSVKLQPKLGLELPAHTAERAHFLLDTPDPTHAGTGKLHPKLY